MKRNVRPSSWMYSPKTFVSLLGAEYHLMQDAGVLKRFYLSALLIVFVLVLTWIGISHALSLLFQAMVVEISLAIFFCLLFLCMYIFLINTFAKENRTQKGGLNISNILRVGFITFMGFLIAQPLMILLYRKALAPDIENRKQQILREHAAKTDELMKDEIARLVNSRAYYMEQKKLFGTSAYDIELEEIDEKLSTVRAKTALLNQTAQQTIERSGLFLFCAQQINRKYQLSWFLTLLTILLFLLPGYLIYAISTQHEYYRLKKAQEKELVASAYHAFVKRYQAMFDNHINIFSRYEDPPFNTIRKRLPVPASMTDFFQKYCHGGLPSKRK